MKRGLALVFGVMLGFAGCVLPALDVTGKSCTQSSDCGPGASCVAGACAKMTGPLLSISGLDASIPAARPSAEAYVEGDYEGVVTLSSSAPGGQFLGPDSGAGWSATLELTLDHGRSDSFRYRDGVAGTDTLLATAPQATQGSARVDVRTDILSDDFESADASTWDRLLGASASSTLAFLPAAAHRGGEGLRVVDSNGAVETGAGAFLYAELAPLSTAYVRFWARAPSTSSQGTVSLFQAEGNAGGAPLAELVTAMPSGNLSLNSVDSSGSNRYLQTTTPLTDGGWHLLEIEVSGVGTAQGQRRLWMDGVALGSPGVAFDWSGSNTLFRYVALGEPWGSNTNFQGLLDFDDFRAATVPLASSLALVVETGQVLATHCYPLSLSLIDSVSGSRAAAPEDTAVSMSAVAGPHLGVFASTDCSGSETATVVLPRGESALTLSVRVAAAGTVRLSAASPDFLPASLVLSAQ